MTSEGPLQLPITYRDTTNLVALFDVPAHKLQPLLGETPLRLVTMGGRTRLAVVFFGYPDTSIGAYNEVGVATFVKPQGVSGLPSLLDVLRAPLKRQTGFYVIDLPVTTARACAAGRELWGLPKFVTPIDCELQGREFTGRVHDPDGADPILSLQGKLPLGMPMTAMELLLLSQLGDTSLRTQVRVQGRYAMGSGGGLRLGVGNSAHPMAERLRSLDLQGARPSATLWSRSADSLLYAGEPLTSARA